MIFGAKIQISIIPITVLTNKDLFEKVDQLYTLLM